MLFSLSWRVYILLLLVVGVGVGFERVGVVIVEFLGFAVWVECSSFPRFSGWCFACCGLVPAAFVLGMLWLLICAGFAASLDWFWVLLGWRSGDCVLISLVVSDFLVWVVGSGVSGGFVTVYGDLVGVVLVVFGLWIGAMQDSHWFGWLF